LQFDEKQAAVAVGRLRKAEVTRRRANDILRPCNLVALPLDDPGVRRDLLNAVSGKRLSPVLVVSTGDGGDIADGYHRVSLGYHLDSLVMSLAHRRRSRLILELPAPFTS
jgi:hypothetical protein